MPRLVKGGKYVFGWSPIGPNGRIKIPPEAFMEYQFKIGEKGIIIPGSKTSGGFGLSSLRLLKDSPIGERITQNKNLSEFKIPKGKTITIKGKLFCWIDIKKGKIINIPEETLSIYNLKVNDHLLSVRGSRLAIGFLVKGPLIKEAKKLKVLDVFK